MNFLQTIVEHKHEEVSKRKSMTKRSTFEAMEYFGRPTLSLREALHRPPFGIIAEIKRSSPSAGAIRNSIEPTDVARQYASHGAAAISVLTDERFFSGTLQDLQHVREVVHLPLLRKEFIIDEYQIFEAKAFGADAVLLIASILEPSQLNDLFLAARELQLQCLVELYEESEIDKLNLDEMNLVGINNRDLRTFSVDITRTFTISRHLPKSATVVSESGITSSDDLQKLKTHGISAALIGEHFMKSEHPGKALQQLLDGMIQ
jgi:indole-3-glycerol phosphate synthase